MKQVLGLGIVALAIAMTMGAVAQAAPSDCWGSSNPKQAFEENVLSTLRSAGYRGVSSVDIRETVVDSHDPGFEVRTSRGLVQVSCDDSGDNDCQCWIGGPNDQN